MNLFKSKLLKKLQLWINWQISKTSKSHRSCFTILKMSTEYIIYNICCISCWFTFVSPSDDTQSTSERKREHLPLSSCRPAAFPQGICLREDKGELLGTEAPLSKYYPCWHVHFLTRNKEKTDFVLFLTLSPSLRHCSLRLSRCSHVLLLSGELPVLSGDSSKPLQKQVQVF